MIKNDCLDFWKKSRNYIENYLFHYWNNWWELNSWMNFITWLWWSWKTTFIGEVIDNLNDNWDEKYLNGRKLITIKFNPWDYQNTKNIYEQFLTSLSWSLLKYKYDDKIKSDSKDLIKILDSKYINFFDWIRKLIYSNNDSIEDLIININKSIQTTYKDFLILVVVDEIDRLEKIDLVNVWKVLNLIKRLLTENQDSNLRKNILCIYSADSYHLSNFYLWDKQDEEWITFFQYFKKFPDTKFDIYQNSIDEIIEYLSVMSIDWENFDLDSREKVLKKSKSLIDELDDLKISISIRDLKFIDRNISQQIDEITNNLFYNYFKGSIYGEVIEKWFISQIVREKLWQAENLKLDYIYLSSIYEKDPTIMKTLMTIYSWMKYYWKDEKKNLIKREWNRKYKFKYKFDDEYTEDKLLDFIENDYSLLLWNFDKNDLWWWYNYIIEKFLMDLWNKISSEDIHGFNNYDKIIDVLFLPNINWNENIFRFTNSNFVDLRKLVQDSLSNEWNIKFLKNSIMIFKDYINNIFNKNWDYTNNNDFWFFISIYFFLYWFIENLRSRGIIKIDEDSLNVENNEIYSEIENILIDFFKFLIDWFSKVDEFSFVKIFLFIRLVRYSISRYRRDSKCMFLLLSECLIKWWFMEKTDINNIFDIIAEKTERYFLNFDSLIEPIDRLLVKMGIENTIKRQWEILNILELVVYIVYDENPIWSKDDAQYWKMYQFFVDYLKDEKYQFLFLCYSLKLWYDYKLYTELRMIDSEIMLKTYREIFRYFNGKWSNIWEFIKKYFDEIWIFMLEKYTWLPRNLWENYMFLKEDKKNIIECISKWLNKYFW